MVEPRATALPRRGVSSPACVRATRRPSPGWSTTGRRHAPGGPQPRRHRRVAEEVVQDTWLGGARGHRPLRGPLVAEDLGLPDPGQHRQDARRARERRTVPLSSLAPDGTTGPTVDPERFRGADDPYPGGWRSFPGAVAAAAGGRGPRRRGARVVAAARSRRCPPASARVITLRDVAGLRRRGGLRRCSTSPRQPAGAAAPRPRRASARGSSDHFGARLAGRRQP